MKRVVIIAKGEDMIYLFHKWPTYDDRGRITGIACFATVSTDHKRMEVVLEATKSKYGVFCYITGNGGIEERNKRTASGF